MSGHSKWATIKHKKGALDAKRGAIFTKLIKEITVAAKNGGSMSGAGSVAWQFTKKGFIVVKKSAVEEDKLMEIVLDAGASDFIATEESYEISTEPNDFEKVKKALADAGIATESAEVTKIAANSVKVTDLAQAKAIMALVENLEDHDDVQNVYSNFDIPDNILQELAK